MKQVWRLVLVFVRKLEGALHESVWEGADSLQGSVGNKTRGTLDDAGGDVKCTSFDWISSWTYIWDKYTPWRKSLCGIHFQ
jgi:hypothetical protein